MKKLHMKSLFQDIKSKELAGNALSVWDVDAAGKVLNYSGQFRAKYALLKEHRKTAA